MNEGMAASLDSGLGYGHGHGHGHERWPSQSDGTHIPLLQRTATNDERSSWPDLGRHEVMTLHSWYDSFTRNDILVGDEVAAISNRPRQGRDEFDLHQGDILVVLQMDRSGWAIGFMTGKVAGRPGTEHLDTIDGRTGMLSFPLSVVCSYRSHAQFSDILDMLRPSVN